MAANTQIHILPEEFTDIAPYDDHQFQAKLAELVTEEGFEHAIRYVMPDVDYAEFVKQLLQVKTQSQFQNETVGAFLEMLVSRTTSGLSMDGQENIDTSVSHTFITNHRDIVLDASFLNLNFIRAKMPLTQIAIGNNLLIYDWITDLVKLNRSFIVKRDVRRLEALEAARHLSAYIHYVITERHEPVWIAQREGRAKDSNDVTQESLIKMLSLAGGGDTKANLLAVNLTPVSISYEFDPNDYLKAREFLMRRRDPQFKKSQRDDLFSMETGILKYKGHIKMHIGKSINDDLAAFVGTERAEVAQYACRLIDQGIHRGYEIYPCNYIAYDAVNDSHQFASHYTADDVESFNAYLEHQLDKVDIDDVSAEERVYMRHMMLTMYANPLANQLAARQ